MLSNPVSSLEILVDPSVPTVAVSCLDAVEESNVAPLEDSNVALAPEEIATLSSLMGRYDQLLLEMDTLSERLEELLKIESKTTVPIVS
ncbi:MAG: hypothetical protein ABL921_32420 [Pirellula sp.]